MNDELRDELAEALAPWCTGEHLEEPPSIGSMPCSRDLRRANDLLPVVERRIAQARAETDLATARKQLGQVRGAVTEYLDALGGSVAPYYRDRIQAALDAAPADETTEQLRNNLWARALSTVHHLDAERDDVWQQLDQEMREHDAALSDARAELDDMTASYRGMRDERDYAQRKLDHVRAAIEALPHGETQGTPWVSDFDLGWRHCRQDVLAVLDAAPAGETGGEPR